MGGVTIKNFLPRTLFGRSLLIIMTPVLLVQVISTFIFFDRHWTAMSTRLAEALAGEIAMLVEEVETTPDGAALNKAIQKAARTIDLVVTLDRDSRALDAPLQNDAFFPSLPVILRNSLDNKLKQPIAIDTTGKEKWIEIQVKTSKGILRIEAPARRIFSSTTYIFILWFFGSSFILFAIAILFMRNQIRPIRKLAVAAERFGKGIDIPAKFKPEGAAEIRQAGQAFLDMRDRIRRQIEQRTAMLAGVSHDLRTPITRMKLQLEMMKETPDTAALRGDISEMERMVEGYLSFVKGEGDETPGANDLTPILARIATNARRAGKAEVEENIARDLIVRIRPQAIERAVGNVVANACKYGKKVWINAYKAMESVEISIDDDGPGLPKESYEDVFKPFFRVEKSRNPKTGGVGLGLSIAQDIIHSHGGEIWLEPSNRSGLRVVIRLPV